MNYFSVSNISEYEPESIMFKSEMINKFLDCEQPHKPVCFFTCQEGLVGVICNLL